MNIEAAAIQASMADSSGRQIALCDALWHRRSRYGAMPGMIHFISGVVRGGLK